jgi:hypothetical protein
VPDCLPRRAGVSIQPRGRRIQLGRRRNCNFITVSPSQGKDLTGYVLRTVYQYLNSYDFAFLISRDIIKSKLARKKKEKKPMAIVFSLKKSQHSKQDPRTFAYRHTQAISSGAADATTPENHRCRERSASEEECAGKTAVVCRKNLAPKQGRHWLFAQRSDRSRATDATNCLVRWGIRIKSV